MLVDTAKNIIMFLGDGMSVPTLAAARVYLGSLQNVSGEELSLSFENFPYSGLSKVGNLDAHNQVIFLVVVLDA